MSAGPCQFGGPGRRRRGKNNGRGPGNIGPVPRGQKIVPRSKRMALKGKRG